MATKEISANDVNVSVVLHNNGEIADGNGSIIIVAAYDGLKFLDSNVYELTADIYANSMTSAIPVKVTVEDSSDVTDVKVMLWDSITNAKPLYNMTLLSY